MGKRYHRQYIGSGIKIGATGNVQYAYDLGRMANEAAASMGNNVAFAPVCDIHYSWQNTEIMTGLLRDDLGLNGVVISDATHMVGMAPEKYKKIMIVYVKSRESAIDKVKTARTAYTLILPFS